MREPLRPGSVVRGGRYELVDATPREPRSLTFPDISSLVPSKGFAAIAPQSGLSSRRSRFRGVCERQALEQCGMRGLIEAQTIPAGAAAAPALGNDDRVIETSIPARLDSLRWSGFHTRVVVALGITWILDGLEVTLAGTLSGALKESPTLQFTNFDVGFSNSAYLAGAVLGALGCDWRTVRVR